MTLACMVMVQFSNAQEIKWSTNRADGHAPIGVMGDHAHHKGEWMMSYRLMDMQMEGILNGSKTIDNSELFTSYSMAPQDMSMQMHMIGLMYASSDKLTLVVMGNFLSNDMSSSMGIGMNTTTIESEGLGDFKFGALYQLFNKDRRSMHLNVGFSAPVGSLTETKAGGSRLGYAMQLGSGTWDANLGFTYLKQYDQFSYGLQSIYLTRLGENMEGYVLGDKWNTSFWGAYAFFKQGSVSLRIENTYLQSIKGSDAMIGMSDMGGMNEMTPVFNPVNSGKIEWDVLLGVNYALFKGAFKGLRLAVEVGFPVYQDVNGIQMKSKTLLTTGIQYAFGGK